MTQVLNEDRLINETQAAEILGRAVQTLRNDRHLRQGAPYIKIGRSIRYQIRDLFEYMKKHRVDPEAAA